MEDFSFDYLDSNDYLSTFYHSPFRVGNEVFNSVEHYYNAQKFNLFSDNYQLIKNAKNSLVAKKIANKFKSKKSWNKNLSLQTMYEANLLKFSQNPKLLNYLLQIENDLIKSNGSNHKWCYGQNGENLLGEILMQIRTILSNKNI